MESVKNPLGLRTVAFGPFTLDLSRFELRRGGELIPTQRKVFDLLRYLIEHRDRMVSPQELLDNVWSETAVTLASVRRTATLLRRALQDDAGSPAGSRHFPAAAIASWVASRRQRPASRPPRSKRGRLRHRTIGAGSWGAAPSRLL
jgi:hypothetical protein